MKKRFSQKNRIFTFRRTAVLAVLLLSVLFLVSCSSRKLNEYKEQAVAEYTAGNYEKARELFDAALAEGNGEVSEKEFDILRYRAECELRMKDYDAAEKTYGILLEVDPSEKNAEIYYDILEQFSRVREISEAAALMQEGNYKEAYLRLNEYASLGGDSAGRMAFFDKAVCAEHMGNWQEAEQLFSEYLKTYPDDAEAEKEYRFCKTRK